jgi:hypothetical protein
MTQSITNILRTADAALARQSEEISQIQTRQRTAVTAQSSSGTGNIDATFKLDVRFRLAFVRCHFVGTSGLAPMTISLDAVVGVSYDATLFTVIRAGVSRDVNLRIPAEESTDPSPWTFQPGDALRIQWTNPDPGNITWGLQVGLAIAS